MPMDEISARAHEVLMPNYNYPPLALVRGEGARVWDADGREYLDFLAGIAVCSSGHCHPEVVEAVKHQAETLMHTSNVFTIPGQVECGERLARLTFAEQMYFTNSGSEAVECALKMARRWQWSQGHPERTGIIAAHNSFHGRTYGAVSCTGTPAYHEGFGPMLPNVRHAAYNDLDAFKAEIKKGDVAAVIIEPIQGEGGIVLGTVEFMQGLRAACDEAGALLIMDEIQAGLGRTGRICAYEHFGITPDIMPIAKALGGGVPVGACLSTRDICSVMKVGTHGSTYGGNPLAMAAANAYLELLERDRLHDLAEARGKLLRELLKDQVGALEVVKEIRGLGLMIGIELTVPSGPVVPHCADHGLLLGRAGENVIRFVPPLIITEDDCREAVRILREALLAL